MFNSHTKYNIIWNRWNRISNRLWTGTFWCTLCR